MATITISVMKSTDTSPIDSIINVSDGAIEQLIATAGALFYPNGMPVAGSTPPAFTTPTGAQILAAMASSIAEGWAANILSYERGIAAQTAVAGVAPITFTLS